MSTNVEYSPEKKGVGRPRDGDPEETRKEILRAAERAFAAAGFSGATTRKIAGDARVNVATLHYHFGGKKGLYRAVLTEVVHGDLPPVPEAGSPAERLRRLAGALFDFTSKRPFLPRLSLLNDLAGPAEDAPDAHVEDRRIALLGTAIHSFRSVPGPERPDPGLVPEEAARLIVRMIDIALVDPLERGGGSAEVRNARVAVVEASLRIAGAA